jgi:hypothetical protein
MNTLFVLLMIGVLQPAHPDHTRYLEELGGVPLSYKREIFPNRAECEKQREHYLGTAPMHHIVVVFHECVPVKVI